MLWVSTSLLCDITITTKVFLVPLWRGKDFHTRVPWSELKPGVSNSWPILAHAPVFKEVFSLNPWNFSHGNKIQQDDGHSCTRCCTSPITLRRRPCRFQPGSPIYERTFHTTNYQSHLPTRPSASLSSWISRVQSSFTPFFANTFANRCILSSLAADWTTRHRPPLSAYACQHSWPIQEDFSITTQLQWHVLEPPTKRLRTTTQKIIGDPQFAHEAGFSQDPFICQFQRLAFQKLFPENQIQPLSPKNTRYHALSSWWHRIVISKHTEFSTVWSPGDIGSFGPLQRVWTDDGWDMYLRVSPYPTALKDLNLIF